MSTLESLQIEIDKIKERNERVEADKAWETSWARRIAIAMLTYIVIAVFLWLLGLPKPFINSIVPMVGFILSTLTISVFKKLWLKYYYKNDTRR